MLSPGRSYTKGLHANVAVLTLYGDRGCACMVVNDLHAWWWMSYMVVNELDAWW